jgi:hypothetical protein
LLVATYANAIDAARMLIQAGADVNAKDNLDDSPYLSIGIETGPPVGMQKGPLFGLSLARRSAPGRLELVRVAQAGRVRVIGLRLGS